MKLSEFAGIDLSALPDEALLAVALAVDTERTRRRRHKISTSKAKLWFDTTLTHSIKSKHRARVWTKIADQDWSDAYPDANGPKEFYVYAHVTPKSKGLRLEGLPAFPGLPFYIGKGTGGRAWDMQRNEGHGIEIRKAMSLGATHDQIAFIVKDGLSEQEAFCLEAKLIYFFGTRFDVEKNGILVNLALPKVSAQCLSRDMRQGDFLAMQSTKMVHSST